MTQCYFFLHSYIMILENPIMCYLNVTAQFSI
uniref:Uncharacterized protein n=1 Tax=Arundo donax TaxID=35708 RepID=A0A0A9A1U2_ARUDO